MLLRRKGSRSYRAIALTSVMSKWHASFIILHLEREKEPESQKNLHVGGIDGISCQHLQVMMTHLLQNTGNGRRNGIPCDDDTCTTKHWEWQEEWNTMLKHGRVIRPTMYLASLDIKTAFDDVKPKHVEQIMDSHNTHGWSIAALLREMLGLEGKAMFECVESSFAFTRCLRQGSVEAPRLWQKIATQILANVQQEWLKKRMRLLLDFRGPTKFAALCGLTTFGSCHTQKKKWNGCFGT